MEFERKVWFDSKFRCKDVSQLKLELEKNWIENWTIKGNVEKNVKKNMKLKSKLKLNLN